MPDFSSTVFLWNDSHQEKTLVAASACADLVEVYYALENRCLRNDVSCTVASHIWYGQRGQFVIEELPVLD